MRLAGVVLVILAINLVVPMLIGALPNINTPFTDYTLTAGETKTWQVPVVNTPLPDMIDVMYVIDTTGSMSGHLPTIAATVNAFNAELVAAGAGDIYFGTAFYGDMDVDHPWFGITLALGSHTLAEVATAINT
jgi:hypothetical protein